MHLQEIELVPTQAGPYYSSVIFFYSLEELHLSINTDILCQSQ